MHLSRPIAPQPHRATLMLSTTLMLGLLGGCGHGSAAAPATATPTHAIASTSAASGTDDQPPASRNPIDWYLVPLTPADVQLYLSVMRAAAERVRHPTAADIAAPKLIESAEAKMQRGHPEAVTAEEDAAIDLAGTLQGQADQLIVAQRHIDVERYGHVVDRVEDAVVPPGMDFVADGDPSSTPYVPTTHDRAVEATRNANIKLLAPYRNEIRALQTVVRDTSPKS